MPIFGWTLTILFVVVPLTAGGFVTIHEIIKATTLPAIKVFHLEALTGIGPCRELVGVRQELITAHDIAVEFFDELSCGERVWFGDGDLCR